MVSIQQSAESGIHMQMQPKCVVCDDGSAGPPLGLSYHPMRRIPTAYPYLQTADKGSTKRLGENGPGCLPPQVDHPQNILSRPKCGSCMATSSYY